MIPHSEQKWFHVIQRVWINQLSIIEPQTNPKVIHKNWEPGHYGNDSHRSPKLIPVNITTLVIYSKKTDPELLPVMIVQELVHFFTFVGSDDLVRTPIDVSLAKAS